MSPKDIGAVAAAAQERIEFQLYRVALVDGTVLRYSDADQDIVWDTGDGGGSATWSAGLGIDRGPVRASIDLQIDTVDLQVRNIDLTLGGVTKPLGHWVKVRKLHGAAVDVYRYDHKTPASMLHSSWKVQGARARIDSVELILESILADLDIEIPRTLFQKECNNALYDLRCGVTRSLYDHTSTVSAATLSTVTYGTLTPPTPPSGSLPSITDAYFDMGEVEFTSGNLVGLKQTIATHVGAVLAFFAPFPEIPTVGSTIKITAGCLKRIVDCKSKFGANRTGAPTAWQQRFRAFPHMPEMEETIG